MWEKKSRHDILTPLRGDEKLPETLVNPIQQIGGFISIATGS